MVRRLALGGVLVIVFIEGVLFFSGSGGIVFSFVLQDDAKKSLLRAEELYTNASRKLKSDEYYLYQRAFDPQKHKTVTFNPEDPFVGILSDELKINAFGLERAVNSLEELKSFLINHGIPPDERLYRTNSWYLQYLGDPMDEVVLAALYCAQIGYDDLDFLILNMYTDNGGYLDTHRVLAYSLLLEAQCYPPERVRPALREAVDNVVRAQKSTSEFDDLYAERISALFWAGEERKVKRSWVRRMIRSQQADGGWADGVTGESNFHTTGLVVFALREFLER